MRLRYRFGSRAAAESAQWVGSKKGLLLWLAEGVRYGVCVASTRIMTRLKVCIVSKGKKLPAIASRNREMTRRSILPHSRVSLFQIGHGRRKCSLLGIAKLVA